VVGITPTSLFHRTNGSNLVRSSRESVFSRNSSSSVTSVNPGRRALYPRRDGKSLPP